MIYDQGYLILGLGDTRYIEMAMNLAASIRVMDPLRRLCLVHDEDARLGSALTSLFTDFAYLPPHPLYKGFMNKLRVFEISPYPETMVIDADCLMVKRDIGRYWKLASESFFSITGSRRTAGRWKGNDIQSLLSQEESPYIVDGNSGVFYFDKSERAREFFLGLNNYYLERHKYLGVGLHRGKPAQTDEIYFGLWMGKSGIDPCRHGGKFGADFVDGLDLARLLDAVRSANRSFYYM